MLDPERGADEGRGRERAGELGGGEEGGGGAALLSLAAHHVHLRLFQANGIFILRFDRMTHASTLTHYRHVSFEVLVEQVPDPPPPAAAIPPPSSYLWA